MVNIFCKKLFFCFQEKLLLKMLSKRLVLLHPNSWRYPLLNFLAAAVSQNFLQRKLIHQQHKKFNSTVYLHSSSDTSDNQSSDENSGGLLTLSSQDVRKTETSIKGHKSKIYVCKCMANLYSCPKLNLCQNEDFSIKLVS